MKSNAKQLPGLRSLFAEEMNKERDEIEAKHRYKAACKELLDQVHSMVTSAIEGQCKSVAVLGDIFKIGNREICKLYPGFGPHGTAPCVGVWTVGNKDTLWHHDTNHAAKSVLKALAKEAAQFER